MATERLFVPATQFNSVSSVQMLDALEDGEGATAITVCRNRVGSRYRFSWTPWRIFMIRGMTMVSGPPSAQGQVHG